MSKAKLTDSKVLEKDLETKAVLNTSISALEMARKMKMQARKFHERNEEIDNYKEIIQDLLKRVKILEDSRK
jgi:hypothetical protein